MRRLSVTRMAGRFQVKAEAGLQADRKTAWRILSDYDALASIVPGLVSSRLISSHALGRRDRMAVVEQHGQVGSGLFRQTFRLTLEVTERAVQCRA